MGRVSGPTKIFFLIFDTFKKKTDQLYGPPYMYNIAIRHHIIVSWLGSDLIVDL
jgi:hypothetical protein